MQAGRRWTVKFKRPACAGRERPIRDFEIVVFCACRRFILTVAAERHKIASDSALTSLSAPQFLRLPAATWGMRGRQIPGLKKYRGRNFKGYFEDLPWDVQRAARGWLWRFCRKWGRDLPGWRFAILVGQAKRLALNPPNSQWGRALLAKRGGRAVQRLYRYQGRNPTEAATREHQARAEARRRRKLGLPEPSRHAFLRLD